MINNCVSRIIKFLCVLLGYLIIWFVPLMIAYQYFELGKHFFPKSYWEDKIEKSAKIIDLDRTFLELEVSEQNMYSEMVRRDSRVLDLHTTSGDSISQALYYGQKNIQIAKANLIADNTNLKVACDELKKVGYLHGRCSEVK